MKGKRAFLCYSSRGDVHIESLKIIAFMSNAEPHEEPQQFGQIVTAICFTENFQKAPVQCQLNKVLQATTWVLHMDCGSWMKDAQHCHCPGPQGWSRGHETQVTAQDWSQTSTRHRCPTGAAAPPPAVPSARPAQEPKGLDLEATRVKETHDLLTRRLFLMSFLPFCLKNTHALLAW